MNLQLASLSWLLVPFSVVYRSIIVLRNKLFDTGFLRSEEFNLPVICVGNISVGGTGKTPHVEYLIELLQTNYKLAVLSRGYKRKSRGFQMVSAGSTASSVGDEPLQIKKKFPKVLVAVDGDRVAGIKNIVKSYPDTEVVLLDDAYQHRWIKPGLIILLVDINRKIYEDHILPAGRLREPAYEKRRAHAIVFTKCPDELKPIDRRILLKEIQPSPLQKVYFSGFAYRDLDPLFPELAQSVSLSSLSKNKPDILLVTGIANPLPLVEFLTQATESVKSLRFPDHHYFTAGDMLKIIREFDQLKSDNKILVITEKDAVRMHDFPQIDDDIRQRMYIIPLKIRFLDQDAGEFNQQILSYVRDFKRNRSVSAFAYHDPS